MDEIKIAIHHRKCVTQNIPSMKNSFHKKNIFAKHFSSKFIILPNQPLRSHHQRTEESKL